MKATKDFYTISGRLNFFICLLAPPFVFIYNLLNGNTLSESFIQFIEDIGQVIVLLIALGLTVAILSAIKGCA